MIHLEQPGLAPVIAARPRERGLKPERGAERATRSAAEPRLIIGRRNSAVLPMSAVSRFLGLLSMGGARRAVRGYQADRLARSGWPACDRVRIVFRES